MALRVHVRQLICGAEMQSPSVFIQMWIHHVFASSHHLFEKLSDGVPVSFDMVCAHARLRIREMARSSGLPFHGQTLATIADRKLPIRLTISWFRRFPQYMHIILHDLLSSNKQAQWSHTSPCRCGGCRSRWWWMWSTANITGLAYCTKWIQTQLNCNNLHKFWSTHTEPCLLTVINLSLNPLIQYI